METATRDGVTTNDTLGGQSPLWRLQSDLKLRRFNEPNFRYCPWMDAMHRGVSVRIVDFASEAMWGRTDGVGIVELSRWLTDFEARCTLAHELVHIERGHTRSQTPEVEHEVTKEAARRLIAPADLEQALSLYSDRAQIAAHLLVTEDVLKHVLTPGEEIQQHG